MLRFHSKPHPITICHSRCVRRGFLCGLDAVTGISYEHRKQWIEDKIHEAATVFALDLCGYAVMSNHYHVVLHVNKPQADSWDMDEIISRWHMLYNGNVISQRYLSGEPLGKAELDTLNEMAELWREQLMDLSWFMRFVNESVTRRANAEDNCTGRFWGRFLLLQNRHTIPPVYKGRFGSQALLDEAAIVACMVYVDLNPIRSKIATTPETFDHTSIKKRIQHILNTEQPEDQKPQPEGLYPFVGNPREDMPGGLPFKLEEYIELVDLTGRQLREGKSGKHAPLHPCNRDISTSMHVTRKRGMGHSFFLLHQPHLQKHTLTWRNQHQGKKPVKPWPSISSVTQNQPSA